MTYDRFFDLLSQVANEYAFTFVPYVRGRVRYSIVHLDLDRNLWTPVDMVSCFVSGDSCPIVSGHEAAASLGLSPRQYKRIIAAVDDRPRHSRKIRSRLLVSTNLTDAKTDKRERKTFRRRHRLHSVGSRF